MQLEDKHKNFAFGFSCDIIGVMGKVIVNKTDATKTARNGSELSEEQVKAKPAVKTAGKVDVKVNQKSNGAGIAKSGAVKAIDNKTADVKSAKPAAKKTKPESGLVVRKKEIDPELALMASRAAAAEKVRVQPNVTQMRRGGRSMSGMIVEKARPVSRSAQAAEVVEDKKLETKSQSASDPEAELRFSKMKSALIGVGVAVVVAVIGFAGIAIFGNNKKMCTVNFESNGGSEVDGEEIVCGRTVKQPEDPVKEGFTFKGWVFEGDPFDFSTGVYKNATLVAHWQANEGTETVTVKFDTDGGSKVDDVEVAKGKKLTRPVTPKKTGYVFDDWYLGDAVYDFNKPVDENITLRAKWVFRSNVTNNNGGGASSGGDSSKPTEKKYAESLAVGDMTVGEGKSAQTSVRVIPSDAEFELMVSSSDADVASCAAAGNSLTCEGKRPGQVMITVKDKLSGNVKTFTLTVEHVHTYENGKCSCGAIDPNHTHSYENGKCTICGAEHQEHDFSDNAPSCKICGVANPNYQAPHVHTYENGKCSCGAIDLTNHTTHVYENGRCTICGAAEEQSTESGTGTNG